MPRARGVEVVTGWLTVVEIAEAAGVEVSDVEWALRFMGLDRASEAHARGEGDERRYSQGVQTLVLRELRTRPGRRGDAG